MKKIYLSILSVALVSGLNAQIKQTSGPVARSNDRKEAKLNVQEANVEKAVTIWESTFGTPAEWVLDHDAANCSLNWEIGMISCGGSYPIDDIASTSANDGWAMIDSDEYGGTTGGTEVEDSWLTMANSVDLTSYPNVVVEFETHYRRYNSELPFVVVGFGDGTGPASVVWPDLDPTFDPATNTQVYDAFPNMANSASTNNPQLVQVNISPALVGATPTQLANVYIRLNWTGTWGYAWFVDDFKLIEQPADDIQTVAAWISGENNDGVEYGRNPADQLDANWLVGANIFNFGINDQTNVTMTADFVSFSSNGNDPLLEADSTVTLETLETPVLTTGTYTGTYTAVSDDETGGAAFGNNVRQRVFEVTSSPQQIYSTDGIDVYPAADLDLTSLGTNSFNISVPGSEDGLVLASMYQIKTPTVVSGVQVMLAPGTVEGGEIYASLKDTTTYWLGDMTSLINAQPVTVTAADITAGSVNIMFDAPYSLTPGEYYAAVELYSNGNSSDIRVMDDRTVDQPYFTAAIYLPGDASYSNGTALGIRMLMGADWIGLDENTLEGVAIYPNPSQGLVNISNDNSVENTIIVHDLAGRQIMSTSVTSATTIDLSAKGTGVYTVTVANENGSVVERIIIK